MRRIMRIATVAALAMLSVGTLAPANAASGTPFSQYAYEQDGSDLIQPTCTPSFTNCAVFQFANVSALSTTPPATDADGNPVQPDVYTPDGSVVVHGVDYFKAHSLNGTFSLKLDSGSTVWSGAYSGTFRGSNAGTASFNLLGTDGSHLSGTVTFLYDGVMQLVGTIR
jgi:hypothetical protein